MNSGKEHRGPLAGLGVQVNLRLKIPMLRTARGWWDRCPITSCAQRLEVEMDGEVDEKETVKRLLEVVDARKR